MKIKRLKRVNRILTFYRYKHGFIPPYSVLMDGTFCQAALTNKINLQEQMPKYLSDEVEIFVTKCVINELGKEVYGGLALARQYKLCKCPHKPLRTASECIKHLARRSKKPEHKKYFIGTQDDHLLKELREINGVPLFSIRVNTIILEKPADANPLHSNDSTKKEIEKIKELKKDILGEEPLKPKRKAPKAPNPLSCKKKKPKMESNNGNKHDLGNEEEQKKPRKRFKKRRILSDKAAIELSEKMLLSKKIDEVAPTTFFATLLNASCSSLLLSSDARDVGNNDVAYLIVGKSNGEVVFFPTDRSESISKFKFDMEVPITALVAGDLRNIGK